MLSQEEKHRYSRHILLDKVGLEGQEKLKSARVMVIGAGGLGCPVLQYLTAAGVGTIGVIDYDKVDETNLQRQILFTTNDVGKNKATAAAERLTAMNPHIKMNVYPEKLTTQNALDIFSEYDIVVDGTDNFSTRYLVNDACVISGKPLVYGAIFKFEGQVSVFNYEDGPSYRCLFPDPPEAGTVPSCSEIGVIGVLPGLIGTQQANEAIKIILGIGNVLSGKLVIYDALSTSQLSLNVSRNEAEINQVLNNKEHFANYDYDFFCGIKANENQKEIDAVTLKELIQQEEIQIIDVRESWEQPQIEDLNAINIPLAQLANKFEQISRDKKVVIYCQRGIRSLSAIEFLEEQGFENLINLKDGIVTWE